MDTQQKDSFEIKGHITCELFDLEGNLIERKEFDNLVTLDTKTAIAELLTGDNLSFPGFTGTINYGAVGTDASTPLASNHTLGTEIARVPVEATDSFGTNFSQMSFYFDPTTGNGLLKEFGAYIDGNGSANTGVLFDRVNIDILKTSLNSLRIVLGITVN